MAAEAQHQRRDHDNRRWNDRDRAATVVDANAQNRRDDRRGDWQSSRHRDTYRRGNWSAPFRYRSFRVCA